MRTWIIAVTGAPPRVTIESPAAVTAMLGIIAVLIAAVAYFLRRELNRNDAAHQALGEHIQVVDADVKRLLAGDVAWVRTLLDRLPR